MNISIIGKGNVGGALGSGWERAGHTVLYGVRSPSSSNEREIEQAVEESNTIVLAVPWSVVPSLLANPTAFKGKLVIDCTNPIAKDFSGLSIGHTDSGGETVARLLPEATVVKAFNTCGFNIMENPHFGSATASLFIAGDDGRSKEIVSQLATDLGFIPVDAGPLAQARYTEALAWLWISMALKYGFGREIAFGILRR
jgi:predicted dinucleotide-binding enzyme